MPPGNEGVPLDGIPAGLTEYTGTQPELRNAVSTIEDFFQEPFSHDLIDKVSAMPPDQYEELRELYSDKVIDTDLTIEKWRHPHHEGTTFSYREDYDTLRTGALHLHDATLEARRSISDIAGLKHMAVLCERTAIRNPLPLAEGSERWRFSRDDLTEEIAFCAQRMRQLLPIAGLIRSGKFILIRYPGDDPPYDTLINPRFDSTNEGRALSYNDPYIEWLLERNPDAYRELQWIYEENDLLERAQSSWDDNRHSHIPHDPSGAEKQLATEVGIELLQKIYRPRVSVEDLKRIMAYSHKIASAQLNPVTSDPLILYHLRQCARVALEGKPARANDIAKVAEISPAVDYGFPSLSEVSFADIIHLRKEEVFVKLRQILLDLNVACANDAQIGSLEDYEAAICRHADDILRPGLAEIQTWERKASRGVMGSKALGKAVKLAVDAFAGGAPLGGVAGKGAERLTGRKSANLKRAAVTAHGILKSLIP